jgi:hypothetical protein
MGSRTPVSRLSQVADVDGDGLTDIVQVESDGKLRIYRRVGPKPGLLTLIRHGLSCPSGQTNCQNEA